MPVIRREGFFSVVAGLRYGAMFFDCDACPNKEGSAECLSSEMAVWDGKIHGQDVSFHTCPLFFRQMQTLNAIEMIEIYEKFGGVDVAKMPYKVFEIMQYWQGAKIEMERQRKT